MLDFLQGACSLARPHSGAVPGSSHIRVLRVEAVESFGDLGWLRHAGCFALHAALSRGGASLDPVGAL